MILKNKDQDIQIEISVPTRTARKELRKWDKKQGERFDKLNKANSDVVAYYNMNEKEKKEAVEKNPDLSQKTFDYIEAISDVSEDIIIEQFKAIVRVDKLTDDQRKVFAQKPDHEFWMHQNMKEIQEAVASFRGSLRGGRSEDQGVT